MRGDPSPGTKDLQELGNRLIIVSADEYLVCLSDSLRPVIDRASQLFGGVAGGRAEFLEYYDSEGSDRTNPSVSGTHFKQGCWTWLGTLIESLCPLPRYVR